jgi:hypothetical protein
VDHIWPKGHNQGLMDMEAKGIQHHLWLRQHPNNATKMVKPHASFVLKYDVFDFFFVKVLVIEFAHKYGSLITKNVLDKKLKSMKSHDYHMLMQ